MMALLILAVVVSGEKQAVVRPLSVVFVPASAAAVSAAAPLYWPACLCVSAAHPLSSAAVLPVTQPDACSVFPCRQSGRECFRDLSALIQNLLCMSSPVHEYTQ